jgi:hypothetical protein
MLLLLSMEVKTNAPISYNLGQDIGCHLFSQQGRMEKPLVKLKVEFVAR